MGKKGIEDMINEIEIFVDSCKFQPLSSNKIVVPKDELESMLNELKLKMPGEIDRCKKIMRNKDAILSDARNRADAMVAEATNEAARLVDENQIVQLANIRANEIIQMANDQANQIIMAANKEADEVRVGALLYTKDHLDSVSQYLMKTLEAEKANFSNLVKSLENDTMIIDSNKKEIEEQISALNNQGKPEPVPYEQTVLDKQTYEENTSYEDPYEDAPMEEEASEAQVSTPVKSAGMVVDDFSYGDGYDYLDE